MLGAIVGSFFATLLVRWPQGRSASVGRSRCDACSAKLSPIDLVPIISFLWLRARCRQCGAPVDSTHFALELSAAAIGLTAFLFDPGLAGFVTALLGWLLLVIAAFDLEHHWLPDRLSILLLIAGMGTGLAGIGPLLTDRLIGIFVGYGGLVVVASIYRWLRRREGLGAGDPKLLAALGAWLGWQQLPYLLLGAGLAGLTAVALARSRGAQINATDKLPLGTLLAIAAWPIWLTIV